MKTKPTVYLIGAGPGDPGLLTLRGAECLGRVDVVLYDGLSNTEILKHAPQAEQISVGKHGQTRIWKQTEIIDEMLRQVRSGNSVARLKGGDPAVFARTAEEVDALHAAEIPFEIVPGITAALAAGSYAGIPITHRKMASAVALVTGHEEPGKAESALDWQALAKFRGTLVIYMGVTTAKVWMDALIACGKDPATPTALVRRCSLHDQSTLHCRLDEVADRLTPASKFRPPVIAIIGPVTQLADTMNWIQHQPLHGQTILVTRPAHQCEPVISAIRDRGGHAIAAPAIAIQPLANCSDIDDSIGELAETDVLVFCSVNGVDAFFTRLHGLGYDSRELAGVQIASVGAKTDDRLQQFGISSDFVPEDYRSSSLVGSLKSWISDKNVTIIRASRGSDELPTKLTALGAIVREVIAYENTDVQQPDATVKSMMTDGDIDWVTVTSSATAKSLHRLYGEQLKQCKLAAISPVTEQTLLSLGYTVDAVANPYTIESLLDEIAIQS